MIVRLAWRLLGRELRSGELRLLFVALVLAVAAVTAVGFFSERVRLALVQQGSRLLGADLVLVGDAPWPAAFREAAVARGLRLAETQIFPSMVQGEGGSQLAEIKAVSAAYPLIGELAVDGRAAAAPPPGSVWVDERLAAALALQPGSEIRVGRSRLRVGGLLTQEPDRGFGFFSLAPRVMLALEDLPATGLTGFGARIRHRLLLAGSAPAIAGFADWARPQLGRGQRLEDLENARPEIRNVLDRAERFLGLASLLTVILAAVAVALAARRYTQRHLDACAVLRCLGVTQGRLLRLQAVLFAVLALVAALVGSVLGHLVHGVLVDWIGQALAWSLPPVPAWSVFASLTLARGGLVAAVLLFGFVWPPLLQLARVPTLRVLRRELGAPAWSARLAAAFGFAALAALVFFFAGDFRLGGLAVLGFTLALAVFWGCARLAVLACGRLRAGVAGAVASGGRQGLANLARHGPANALQIVALAVGLTALLLLSVTGQQLLAAWQAATPPDAPNRFLINIQPAQRQAVREALRARGIEAELSPMIRARLLRIGSQPVSAASFPDDERAQRLVEREFNLSWRSDLPPGNRQTAGRWFTTADQGRGLASVEEGLACTLGIQVGETLVFLIDGREQALEVVGLRKLEWDSMRVNFFVLTPPGVLDAAPASDITSFHLPAGREAAVDALLAEFPNLTLIDVAAMVRQFERIIQQVLAAIRVIFVFTLLAGAVVLHAALLAAFDERRHELALLRALGADRRQLRWTLLVELGTVGLLAGLLAALASTLIGQVLAQRVLQLELPWQPGVLFWSVLAGVGLAAGGGWLAARRLLRTSPLAVLRETA